ncbi:hypothetical protein QTP86_014211, partial [Hemibagrus guttatus]
MTVEWFKLHVEDSLVHLYVDNKSKNEGQTQSFRGRTSLFKEELQKGNVSLNVSALRVSYEGEYKCLVEDKSWYDDITVNVIVKEKEPLCLLKIHRYTDTVRASVLHRINVYDNSDSNRFYSRLQQKYHMLEAEIIINSGFTLGKVFDAWTCIVGISVSACLIAVEWIVTAVVCHKK